VLCFDTFREFSHKIYAATMDGKGEEGTYNFFSRRLGGSRGAEHRAQGAAAPPPATPLAPPMRSRCSGDSVFVVTSFLVQAHCKCKSRAQSSASGKFPKFRFRFRYNCVVGDVFFLFWHVRQTSLLLERAMWYIILKVRATDTVQQTFVFIYKFVQRHWIYATPGRVIEIILSILRWHFAA